MAQDFDLLWQAPQLSQYVKRKEPRSNELERGSFLFPATWLEIDQHGPRHHQHRPGHNHSRHAFQTSQEQR